MARTLMACLPPCFELVLESFGKNPIAADLGKFRVIFFFIANGTCILCVLIRMMAILMRTHNKPSPIMPPNLAL